MKQLTKIFKALANEHRLAIFDQIRRQELRCRGRFEGVSVCDVASLFNLALSTVSHHLKELREARLIVCEKRGQWVYCRVNHEVAKEVMAFFEKT